VDVKAYLGLVFVKYSEGTLHKFDCLQVNREISGLVRREFGASFDSLES
jgi:hypothetical protein